MLSVNLTLRKAYFATLNNITYLGDPVKVFWSQLPTTIAPGIYIIFGQIRNVDIGNKSRSLTLTSVTVSVYTNHLKYNDGIAVDVVAGEVLNRIYKDQRFKLDLNSDFFNILGTTLQSDFSQDFTEDKQNVYIDRIMIFQHTIFQNAS